MKKVAILILFMLGCAISEGYAQKVALKSNLLYDATTTMNLGLEIGLVRKWTLDIPVNYNPWKLSDGKRLRHDKYPCATCGTRLKESSKNYFGPTKASVSLIYVIK